MNSVSSLICYKLHISILTFIQEDTEHSDISIILKINLYK